MTRPPPIWDGHKFEVVEDICDEGVDVDELTKTRTSWRLDRREPAATWATGWGD